MNSSAGAGNYRRGSAKGEKVMHIYSTYISLKTSPPHFLFTCTTGSLPSGVKCAKWHCIAGGLVLKAHWLCWHHDHSPSVRCRSSRALLILRTLKSRIRVSMFQSDHDSLRKCWSHSSITLDTDLFPL